MPNSLVDCIGCLKSVKQLSICTDKQEDANELDFKCIISVAKAEMWSSVSRLTQWLTFS